MAYTAPAYNAVNFEMATSYTAPVYNAIPFEFNAIVSAIQNSFFLMFV